MTTQAWIVDGRGAHVVTEIWARLAFRERGPCFVVRVPNGHPLAAEIAEGTRLRIERVSDLNPGSTLTWWEGSLGDSVLHADHVEAVSYPDVDPRWLDEEGCEA